jgi:2-polyprenyl-6-methoxyphenol hydroxylase-like FAD-dependent oxidoreductase
MTQPTILISGAGVAGPALAHWLSANGYRVVVVEVAPGIRPGGQTVDLRGAGRGVVERMGLLDQMADRSMRQRGIAWVRSDGSRRAEMPVEAFDGNGVVSKLEILRGDLVNVLYQHTKDCVEYRFDTRIAVLEQTDDAVDVTLTDGTTLLADLVVGADGPHSAVRRMVFGPEEQFVKPLGGYHAWFTAPDTAGLDGWYLMHQAPGGLNASMRPSHDPAIGKAGLAFRSEPLTYDRRDLEQQRKLLADRFNGVGWHAADWSVRQRKPTTSTSTPSPRCAWRRGRRAAWRCVVTLDTVRRRSPAWGRAWRWWGPTCWPESLVKQATG